MNDLPLSCLLEAALSVEEVLEVATGHFSDHLTTIAPRPAIAAYLLDAATGGLLLRKEAGWPDGALPPEWPRDSGGLWDVLQSTVPLVLRRGPSLSSATEGGSGDLVAPITIQAPCGPIGLLIFSWLGTSLSNEQEQQVRSALAEVVEAQAALGLALRRSQTTEALREIGTAAGRPGMLREEVAHYFDEVMDAVRLAGRPKPDMLAFQVVDWRRGVIRTLVTHGLPPDFRNLPPRWLDVPPGGRIDIQADIVNRGQVEVIVGRDPDRFDQDTFERYDHQEYVRIWIPLFVLPASVQGQFDRGNLTIEGLIQWEEPKGTPGYRSRVGRLDELMAPSRFLVFGTLEVGYLRKNLDRLSFDVLNEELASWLAAVAWAKGRDLYAHTLLGALESMGRSAATAARARSASFTCYLRRGRKLVRWTYPINGSWRVAPAEMVEGMEFDKLAFPQLDLSEEPFVGGSPEALAAWHRHRLRLLEVAEEAIKASANTAFRIESATTRPYELREVAENEDRHGTLGVDETARSICKEVYLDAGTRWTRLIRLEWVETEQGPTLATYGPVLRYPPSPDASAPRDEEVAALARGIALKRVLSEEQRGQQLTVGIPIELVDGNFVVLLAAYPADSYSTQERRWLEGRVGNWVHRLNHRQMHLARSFERLMSRLRSDIVSCREKSLDLHDSEERAEHFIRLVLQRFVFQLQAINAVFTRRVHQRTGPQPTVRTWCFPMGEGQAAAYILNKDHSRAIYSPCNEACDSGALVLNRASPGWNDGEPVREIGAVLELAGHQASIDGKQEVADEVDRLLRGERRPWTLFTVPILWRTEPQEGERVALNVMLMRAHYLRSPQQRAVEELGHLIGDALLTVRQVDARAAESRHRAEVERRCSAMESAERIPDVTAALLAGMGKRSRTSGAPWGLADHVAIWIVGQDGRELSLLAGRGRVVDELRSAGLPWFPDIFGHPLVEEGGYRQVECDPATPWKSRVVLELPFGAKVISLANRRDPLSRVYDLVPGAPWLLSFPVVDSSNNVFGIIDCLRAEPLTQAEDAILAPLLQRLGAAISASVEQSRLRLSRHFARELFEATRELLRQGRAPAVYAAAVNLTRQWASAERVDLFLWRRDRLVQVASSDGEPTREFEDHPWVDSGENHPEGSGARIVHTNQSNPSWGPTVHNLESSFHSTIEEDLRRERMLIPVKIEGAEGGQCPGVIYIVNQVTPSRRTNSAKVYKTGRVFTAEDLRLAIALAEQVERALQISQLAEQQTWLFRELVHSLCQPIQVVHNRVNDYVRLLMQHNVWGTDGGKVRDQVKEAVELVHLARDRLQYFSTLGGKTRATSFEVGDLGILVVRCCQLLAPIGRQNGNLIDHSLVPKGVRVPFDETSMKVALINLIENAVKYSYANRPVEVTLTEHPAEHGSIVAIHIANEGVGIPAEGLKRIERSRGTAVHDPEEEPPQRLFLPYYRAAVQDARGARPGTGVGLSIVWEAITAVHGGRVWADSRPKHRAREGRMSDVTNVLHETSLMVELTSEKLYILREIHHKSSPNGGRPS